LGTPFLLLARLAPEARGLWLGTNVALLPFHHPLRIAEEALAVDTLSGGRCIFGVGQGYTPSEFEAFGIPRQDRGAIFTEALTIIKGLFRGESVTFEGKHYRVKNASLPWKPVRPGGPPIWIGAQTPRGVRRAARMADAFAGGVHTPYHKLLEFSNIYRDSLKALGKDPLHAELSAMRSVFIDEDGNKARERALAWARRGYKIIVDWDHPLHRAGVTLDDYATASLAGQPDEIVSQLERYRDEVRATWVICSFEEAGLGAEGLDASLSLFSRKVMVHLEEGRAS